MVEAHGINECKNIVIAEPLSMHAEGVSAEWLTNYRATLRRLLEGKTVLNKEGVSIRFTPEPFAHFKYSPSRIAAPLSAACPNECPRNRLWRWDMRCLHNTNHERGRCKRRGTKQTSACWKITSGRRLHLKSSNSGTFAEKDHPPDIVSTKNALRYKEWFEGRRSIEAIDKSYRSLIESFHKLVHRVENLKLSLSKSATDWSLTDEQRFSASITLPIDPFVSGSKVTTLSMSVAELRDVFVTKVYVPQLKPFFEARLGPKAALENNSLTVALLSGGGSANIGWLQEAPDPRLPRAPKRGTFQSKYRTTSKS